MKWIRERDELIAQTLAFVQSVTGKKDDRLQPDAPTVAQTVTVEVVTVEAVAVETVALEVEPQQELTPAPLPAAMPPPQPPFVPPARASGDFRSEMQTRIANFRKHQERFEREREEYCAATLTKLRAAIHEIPPPRPAGK